VTPLTCPSFLDRAHLAFELANRAGERHLSVSSAFRTIDRVRPSSPSTASWQAVLDGNGDLWCEMPFSPTNAPEVLM
jgi:hypothetical protein